MLVSHDRALLREVCDEFWLVTKGGISDFDGDLDDYQRWLIEQSRQQAAANKAAQQVKAAPVAAPAPPPVRAKQPEQAKPLKAELKKVDERMASLHAERDQINAKLCDLKLSTPDRTELSKRLKTVSDELDTLEIRWLELGDALDSLTR
jgi:ATP-binding cassette subfamily F protein 3